MDKKNKLYRTYQRRRMRNAEGEKGGRSVVRGERKKGRGEEVSIHSFYSPTNIMYSMVGYLL